ncbi:MAG TPA: pimeloyl-ACP methyl ester esterase BioH [Casimicrobiaceae bacterium]|nr:pimeloyl-ACP methyl ester esterase BioH [Casimicrobiaceae bacterium]
MSATPPRLHVESVGQGRPLVLLHGWALHAGLFAPILPALATAHRVRAVDLPGHGHSAPLADWSIERVVDVLDAELGDDDTPPDVLGWSLGGLCALAWARRHPGRVRRLVLVATTPRFAAGDDWPHAMAPLTLSRFADELRVAYRATLQRFLTLQVQGSDEGRATLAEMRHALFARGTPDPAVLSEALVTLAATDVRADVPGIRNPVLVVAGDRDTLAPVEAAAWLADALPDARLAQIAGAAHAPFLSHRDAFLGIVAGFLR